MLPSGYLAAAPLCMTVLQQVCNLVSVLGMDSHREGIAAFRCLFHGPALFVPTGTLWGICLNTLLYRLGYIFYRILVARSAYSLSPSMIASARPSTVVLLSAIPSPLYQGSPYPY